MNHRFRGPLWPALYLGGYFTAVGALLWALAGEVTQLVFFGLIGIATGAGFLIHALARPSRKALGRRLSLAIVGGSLFVGVGIFGRQSFQLEGLFFHVTAGVAGGVVVHYLVAKIVGPLLIGRAWCGWGCWIWMVLDRLPWKRSTINRNGWGWLRGLHFALSLGLVVLLALGLGYDHGFEWKRTDGLWWFLGGCAVYYAIGIALAVAFRDNRAFCKLLCPNTVFLRAGASLSLLRIAGAREGCTSCGACAKACPMGVQVSTLLREEGQVRDPECTLCQSCVAACPRGCLQPSLRCPTRARLPHPGDRAPAGA